MPPAERGVEAPSRGGAPDLGLLALDELLRVLGVTIVK